MRTFKDSNDILENSTTTKMNEKRKAKYIGLGWKQTYIQSHKSLKIL